MVCKYLRLSDRSIFSCFSLLWTNPVGAGRYKGHGFPPVAVAYSCKFRGTSARVNNYAVLRQLKRRNCFRLIHHHISLKAKQLQVLRIIRTLPDERSELHRKLNVKRDRPVPSACLSSPESEGGAEITNNTVSYHAGRTGRQSVCPFKTILNYIRLLARDQRRLTLFCLHGPAAPFWFSLIRCIWFEASDLSFTAESASKVALFHQGFSSVLAFLF